VKGEFNQSFDVNKVRASLDGVSVFVAPDAQQYVLLVRPGKKTVINGEVITEPDITAFFKDFTYRTDDPEVAELIRKTPAFKAGRVKELGTLRAEKAKQAIDAKVKEVVSDPELTKAVLASLKQGRSSTPEVVK
jgi:hypothetical protein